MKNTWKKVPGIFAEVNELGEVRSIDRIITMSNGSGKIWDQLIAGKELSIPPVPDKKYVGINIRDDENNRRRHLLHHLMAKTFLNWIPDGCRSNSIVVDHIDNNKRNNRLDNLQLITNKQNLQKEWKRRI